jgi:hypothetical protein
VAATEPRSDKPNALGAVLLTAAIGLAGSRLAMAESAPERAQIGFKYLDYRESQPGSDRVKVRAPSVMVMTPIAGEWSITGTYTYDALSGASPAYHTQQLTKLEDQRRALDMTVTRYFSRGTLTVGASRSKESDYLSRTLSVLGSVLSVDRNTTFSFGLGVTGDKIDPSYGGIHERKKIVDAMIGVTQVITRQDIMQVNLGYSQGHGYYSDPYKLFDNRPRERDHSTLLARWNHHFDATDGVARLSYRYYRDTWEMRSHTLGAEYVQPIANGWKLTPSVRFYAQNAAKFYVPTDPASTPDPTPPPIWANEYSEDQRLSGFGASTYGFKLAKQLDQDWLLDIKLERYQQRGRRALSGDGDPGLAPFNARSLQLGITHFF